MDALRLLKQKELALARVRCELEALRIVAPLLIDDMDDSEVLPSFAERTGTDDPVPSTKESWGLIRKLSWRVQSRK
jgi:hypothetical protein